jgi:NAD(P)-dependent dehydrogenase (short-subunit alcohol dehydrogenase family)
MAGMVELRNRVAVVTGGASGIGRGIASQLVAQGAQVVIADIEASVLQQTARDIGALGIVTDVTSHASVAALASQTLERFGAVHIVCNNAGVGSMGKIENLSMADWNWVLNVNLMGVIHGVNVFLPLLIRNAGGGHIVNTASLAGLSVMPGMAAYSVTKFAIVALTETLALELATDHPQVGATVFCPGPVRSNIGKSLRNRIDASSSGLVDVDLDDLKEAFGGTVPWMESDQAGRIVVDAIRGGRLYAITHPDMVEAIKPRHAAIEAAFR